MLFARKVVFPLQEFVKGKNTLARTRHLERTQWLSRARLRELQFDRLKEHLEFAYGHVPYYRHLFDEYDAQPHRIQTLDDFQKIPYLTRDTLRREFDSLRANISMRGKHKISTGGSSGSPVAILADPKRNSFIDAARLRAHRWFQADIGEREIVVWGSPIEITRQDYIRNIRDRFLNSRLLSAFNLGETNLAAYAEEIIRFKPVKMYGYASALYVLAQYFRRSKRRPPNCLKVVFATAEPLFEFQRRTIEEVFETKVAVEYVARDAGLMANECPDGGLHIPLEGMLIELDTVSGMSGEVVVTNLDSMAMPIVRYRTGDVAVWQNEVCHCGRGLPLLKSIEGRQTDFLLTPDGRLIHALAVIYVLREVPEIEQFQVLQDSLRNISVKIVPYREFGPRVEQTIVQRLKAILGSEMVIEITVYPVIDTSASGKFRYVLSNVARSYFENALESSS